MIRVSINPTNPLMCRKRRLNGAVLRMRHEKPRFRVTAGVAPDRSLPAQRPCNMLLDFYTLSLICYSTSIHCHPVRIRVRIGSSASPCVSLEATEWGGPSDETGKTEVPCHSRCGTIKIPPCSKALSAKHRPKLCSPSPAMVTSPYQ
jgi:hypothetical protein